LPPHIKFSPAVFHRKRYLCPKTPINVCIFLAGVFTQALENHPNTHSFAKGSWFVTVMAQLGRDLCRFSEMGFKYD
jgi:hypothetical protein